MTKGSCQSTHESNVQKCENPASSARLASSITFFAGAFVWATNPKSMSYTFPSRSLRFSSSSVRGCSASSQVSVEAPAKELPVSLLAHVLLVLNHDGPSRQHRRHLALDTHSFVGRVVDVHVVRLDRKGVRGVRIVEHQVGVGPRSDESLLWKEAEHSRRCRGRDVNPSSEGYLAHRHSLEDQVDAMLDAGDAVGDLREVAHPELLLFLEAEGAVIRRDDAEIVRTQSPPEFGVVTFGSKRRRADVLRAFEALASEIDVGEKEVLRTRFGEHAFTTISRLHDLVERFGGGEVDNVKRCARDVRELDSAVSRFAL